MHRKVKVKDPNKRVETPTIYAYTQPIYPGFMKVGYTKRTVKERMREIFGPKPPDGFPQAYEIVFAAPAYYANGNPFFVKPHS
jgi:hypothetical protein